MQYRKKRSRKNAVTACTLCALLSLTGAVISVSDKGSFMIPLTAALSAFFFALFALTAGRYLCSDVIYSITDDNRFEIHILSGDKAVRVFSESISRGESLLKRSDFKKEKDKNKKKIEKNKIYIESSFCCELFSGDEYVYSFYRESDLEDTDEEKKLSGIVITVGEDFAQILRAMIERSKN